MRRSPAKLPDLEAIDAAKVRSWSVDETGRQLTVCVGREDAEEPVRVFTSETPEAVHVLLVPSRGPYKIGDTLEPGPETLFKYFAELDVPLGSRQVIDASIWTDPLEPEATRTPARRRTRLARRLSARRPR